MASRTNTPAGGSASKEKFDEGSPLIVSMVEQACESQDLPEKFSFRASFKSKFKLPKLKTKRANERERRAALAFWNPHVSTHYAPISDEGPSKQQLPGNPIPACLDLRLTCSKRCAKSLKHGSSLCRKGEKRAATSESKDPICECCYKLLATAWDEEIRYQERRLDEQVYERRRKKVDTTSLDYCNAMRDRELEYFKPDNYSGSDEFGSYYEESNSWSDKSARLSPLACSSLCSSPTNDLPPMSRRSRRRAARHANLRDCGTPSPGSGGNLGSFGRSSVSSYHTDGLTSPYQDFYTPPTTPCHSPAGSLLSHYASPAGSSSDTHTDDPVDAYIGTLDLYLETIEAYMKESVRSHSSASSLSSIESSISDYERLISKSSDSKSASTSEEKEVSSTEQGWEAKGRESAE
ncbi:MAG: hypothetical protein M1836_004152 [Candelina mexicana]|nr:MAG: hypothetical protein M1836_004152 [Candelina mexicana]